MSPFLALLNLMSLVSFLGFAARLGWDYKITCRDFYRVVSWLFDKIFGRFFEKKNKPD